MLLLKCFVKYLSTYLILHLIYDANIAGKRKDNEYLRPQYNSGMHHKDHFGPHKDFINTNF